ncbi:MAG: glyoxalase [Prosthecobacter sp.]|nr:glyoxalase [Prosthecobacter sp.]
MGQLGYLPGDLGWSELTTSSAAEAMKFYAALVGWEDKGEAMPGYHLFGRGDETLGAITDAPPDPDLERTPRWMPYITVDDLNVALGKVTGLGGAILMPLPAGGWRAHRHHPGSPGRGDGSGTIYQKVLSCPIWLGCGGKKRKDTKTR